MIMYSLNIYSTSVQSTLLSIGYTPSTILGTCYKAEKDAGSVFKESTFSCGTEMHKEDISAPGGGCYQNNMCRALWEPQTVS